MVSITGSVRAGIEVAQAAAAGLKRVHLELGGKAPVVVFDDADPRRTASADRRRPATTTRARTAPPRPGCWPAPGIAADLTDALVEAGRGVKTGGLERPDADYGPLNNPAQLARVEGFVDRAPGHAKVLAGGHRVGERGYCYAPTVVAGLRPGRRDDPGRDLRAGHHGAAVQLRGAGGALGERGEVRAGLQRLDDAITAAPCGWPGGWTSARCGSTRTSRSFPRCRTAASSTRATARTCPVYGFEDYTRIKHVMSSLDS